MSASLEIGAAPRGCGDLTAWLAWQEAAHPKSWDLGLERIGKVWRKLGAPRIAKNILSIAGTNGKGSCAVWAETICKTHGIAAASFTSPHLLDYRERIRFNGIPVSADKLCSAFDAVDTARGSISLTYFEWSALAAFYLMAESQPDVAILEVGLGGRLDAVNLIDADAAVFTRIGLDHQDWLGDTVEKIVMEKSGIMRRNQRAVFADAQPPQALSDAAAQAGVRLWRFGRELCCEALSDGLHLVLPEGEYYLPFPAFMYGKHQYGHLAAVAAVLGEWFVLRGADLSAAVLCAQNTARLMIKNGSPRYIIDVAHNADSAEVLAEFLSDRRRGNERLHIVCGMLKDKDRFAVFQMLEPLQARWYFADLGGIRGASAQMLAKSAAEAGIDTAQCYESPAAALHAAEAAAGADETIVVMGSFVTVGEILTLWSSK